MFLSFICSYVININIYCYHESSNICSFKILRVYIAFDHPLRLMSYHHLLFSTDVSAVTESLPSTELSKKELSLLDLYSGCGGMSTGLCLGAKTASVNLVTVLWMKCFCDEIFPIYGFHGISSMINLSCFGCCFFSEMGCW